MNYIVDVLDWTKKTKNKMLKIDFIRFGLVGSVGFVTNFIFLSVFYKMLAIEILIAQIMAGEIALLIIFMLHNSWTYKGHDHIPKWKKLLNFHGTQWTGQLLILIIVALGVKGLKINYGYSLAIASILVMFWNYAWTKLYVFKSNK